jgi:hypothetical protein
MKTQLLPAINNTLLEVDNIFICVEKMPEEGFFQDAGLIFANTPVKQMERGTASQILFFENFYLEFIWVEDEVAAEIYAVRTGIDFLGRAHWQKNQVSPYGIALHQRSQAMQTVEELDFWQSPPQASELLLSFSSDNLIAQNEPLCFMVPDAIALPTLLRKFPDFQRQFASHPLGVKRMTGIEINTTSQNPFTQPLGMLVQNGEVQIEWGNPCIQLTFDNHVQGGILDARDINIPLILKY